MDTTNYTESVQLLAAQYNETLKSLELEQLTTHEYGERWNKEQHALLDSIKDVTATFMKQNNYNGIEHYEQLVTAARNVIITNNITFTVQAI
jgi:Skp family chaperone for outer membrane proteins